MKLKTAILLITAPAVCAGTTETAPAPSEDWITPLIDIRARYEFGDVDGVDTSHAFTFRERLGLKTMAWNGFSALVEGEFSQAAIDDYNGGAPLADPAVLGNTVISDPETTEQTYDAISLSNKCIDGLTLNYSYINQVNRIFGSEAGGTLENLPGDLNLLNASYTGIAGVTLGGYAYNMNFDDTPGLENNTFGLSAKGDAFGLALYGELAWQDGAGAIAEDEAFYGHFTATKAFGKQSVTVGIESLGEGFKTPLATVHAFNGFADAFIGGRINGNHNGLANPYISHTIPIFWGVKWTNTLHAMGDNEISTGYGWEIDSVLAKKFNDNFLAIAKSAHFESEGDAISGASGLPTTTRFSLEMNYTF